MTNGRANLEAPFDICHSSFDSVEAISSFHLRASPDATENTMQRMCFPPNFAGFGFQLGFGNRDHAEKELRLTRFFSASANTVFKIGFGNTVVGLAIVCTHTRSRSNQLV